VGTINTPAFLEQALSRSFSEGAATLSCPGAALNS
jgi:hypothetical protein